MSDVTAYMCPQCDAALKLDPATGKLTCDYCGGVFDVEVVENIVDGTNARKKAEEEAKKARWNSKKKKAADDGFVYSAPEDLEELTIEEWEARLAESDVEEFDEVVGYTCTNCGAQVVTDKLTVATSCQYCGSSVVVDQRLSGGMKPNFVIPFKVKAKDLADKLTKFYENKPLLPKNFFSENQVGEVQGLYVPFWLYDGTVDGKTVYQSSKYDFYRSGGDDVTEITEYESVREGYVEFADIPVDASVRIDDDLMDSIEPFDYGGMKPFKPGYLTGFVAERFDQSPREVFERAGTRMKRTTEDKFRSHIPGSNAHAIVRSFEFSKAKASYVLMPVYLFNCKYGGKLYRYAVNGQTGKIVGEVPTGKRETMMAFLKTFAKTGGVAMVVCAAIITGIALM